MPDSYCVIDNRLGVQPLTAYLSKTGTWLDKGFLHGNVLNGSVVGNAGNVPLPVTPDGQLKPGVLYESSTEPNTRFYLPQYQMNVAAGRYTTSLKWCDDQRNGLALLTLDVAPVVPPPGGFTLREIPHQAAARIVYQFPMELAGGAAADPMAPFLGAWTNADLATRGMTRLEIARLDDGSFEFHGFGKCHPKDCDWDTTPARQQGDALVGTYDFHFKTTTITVRRSGNTLTADLVDHYAPGDGRPDRTEHDILKGGGGPVTPPTGRATLSLEVGALQQVAPGVRRATLYVQTKSDFDRLYQVMTDPTLEARVEIRCFATAGRRTWKQIVLGSIDLDARLSVIANKKLVLTDLRAKVPAAPHVAPVTPLHGPVAAQPVGLPAADLNDRPIVHPGAPAGHAPSPGPRAAEPLPVMWRSRALPLKDVLKNSDVLARVAARTVKAVPTKAITEDSGQPALIQVAVETREEIRPFSFPVATNAYMFDIPGDMLPSGRHRLIPIEIRDTGGQVLGIFYQDSGYADSFYYQPQQFRLPRVGTAPYLPDLRIVFYDVASEAEGNGDEPAVNYKVRLAYRLAPYVDPLLLDLAQQQVPGVQARFSALAPDSTTLTLRIPEDEHGGNLTDVARSDVEVRFDQGVVDEIELSRSEFERVFSFFQSAAGAGVEGTVQAVLPGNVTARVPVLLSLKQNAGTSLVHTYLGVQDSGLHRVRLANRLESPVTIEAFYRVALGGGVFALPQAAPGQTLRPGDEIDIDYRIQGGGAAIADIPPALSISISPDASALWPQIFVNEGYTSDTFPVHVTIDPAFFTVPPGGSEPLSGVLVEFDAGPSVTLTAATPAADVRLRIPLLPLLMGDPQGKQYAYRTTNLFGADAHPGTTSQPMHGEGEAPLAIVPLQG